MFCRCMHALAEGVFHAASTTITLSRRLCIARCLLVPGTCCKQMVSKLQGPNTTLQATRPAQFPGVQGDYREIKESVCRERKPVHIRKLDSQRHGRAQCDLTLSGRLHLHS